MREFVIKMNMDDIPKGCGYCDLEYDCMECMITGTAHHWPRDGRNINTLEERHKNCPLVCVLPKGHGPIVDFEDVGVDYCDNPYIEEEDILVPADKSESE